MAAASDLLAIVRFGLIICFITFSFTVTTTQAKNDQDDKDDKGNKWDKCPPPPSPPPHKCPPPPPKCNPGCIPAPPPCRSKSCCAKCGHRCLPDHKRSPPPKDSKPQQRKGSKRPPPKKDDDHLTDEDVSNLNDLLNLQLLLSNIYLKANSGLKKQRPGSKVDQTSGEDVDDEQQELVSRVFDEFSTTSIQQTSSLISVLNQTSSPQASNITDIANLSGGVNQAFNGSLNPQFNAEDSPMNMLLAVQSIGPSLLASVAASILPSLESTRAITLVSSILPVAASQDSSMRTILFMQRDAVVEPYNLTVSEFMQRTNTMFRSLASEESDDQPNNFLSIVRLTIGMSARSVTNFLNGVLGLVGIRALSGRI